MTDLLLWNCTIAVVSLLIRRPFRAFFLYMLSEASRRPMLTYGRLVLFWAILAALLAGFGPIAAAFRNRWATAALQGAFVSGGCIFVIFMFSLRGWTNTSECGVGVDRRTPLRLSLGVALGLLLLACPVLVLATVDGVRWVAGQSADLPTLAAVFGAHVLLACMEEVGFRSYPLLGIKDTVGLWTAQLIVAVAFIAYHVLGGRPWFGAVVGTGLGSLVFGTAAVASRGLALPIGIHAAWNFGSWALGDKGMPGIWTPVFAHPASAAGTFAYIAAFLLWSTGFVVWERRARRTGSAGPDGQFLQSPKADG